MSDASKFASMISSATNVAAGVAMAGAGASAIYLAFRAAQALGAVKNRISLEAFGIDHNIKPDARTLAAIEAFTESVNNGVGAVTALAEAARHMFEDAFKGISNGLRLASSFAALVVFVFQVTSDCSRLQRAAAVAQFLNILYAHGYLSVSLALIKSCLSSIASFFDGHAQADNGPDHATLYYAITQVLASIMEIKFTTPVNFIREFNLKYTFARNVKSAFSVLHTICLYAASALFKFITGKELYPVTIKPVMEGVEKLCVDMNAFILTSPRGLVCAEPSVYAKSLDLYDRMRVMNESLRALKLTGYYLTDYNATCSVFTTLHQDLTRSVSSQAARVEPVWLHITGPAGTYKSSTVTKLVSVLAGAHGVDTDKVSFSKAPSSDYYDGYCGQLVYREDDILVSNAQENHQATVERFIGLVNNQPLTLDMAAVESKNAYSFVSRYVITTSNAETLRRDVVASPEAWTRRQTLYVVPITAATVAETKYRVMAVHGPTDFKYKEGDCLTFNDLCECVILLGKYKESVYKDMVVDEAALRALGASIVGVAQGPDRPPVSTADGSTQTVPDKPDRVAPGSDERYPHIKDRTVGKRREDYKPDDPIQPYIESFLAGDPKDNGWTDVGFCGNVWVKPALLWTFETTPPYPIYAVETFSSILVEGIGVIYIKGQCFVIAVNGFDVDTVHTKLIVSAVSHKVPYVPNRVVALRDSIERKFTSWRLGWQMLDTRLTAGAKFSEIWEHHKWELVQTIMIYTAVFASASWLVEKATAYFSGDTPSRGGKYIKPDTYAQTPYPRDYHNPVDEERGPRARVKAYGFNRDKRNPALSGMFAQALEASVEAAQAVGLKVSKNMVRVGLGLRRDHADVSLTGVYLRDRVLLVPSHLFSTGFALDNDEDDVWIIVRTASGDVTSVKCRDVLFNYYEDRDYVIIDVKTKHTFADITAHLPGRQRFAAKFDQIGIIKFDPVPSNRTSTHVTTNVRTLDRATYSGSGVPITCRELITVDSMTVSGDCGSPYIDYTDGAAARFVGIHVASINTRSSGAFICREDLEGLEIVEPRTKNKATGRAMSTDKFLSTGTPQSGASFVHLVSTPRKSKIKPSPVSERLTALGHAVKYHPPDLSPGGLARTKESVVARLTKKATALPAIDYDEARRALLLMIPRSTRSGTLGLFDAINGTNTKHLKRIPMSTSAGLPYTLNPGSGKSAYFAETADGLLEPVPVVEQECSIILDYIRNGDGAEFGKPNPVAFVVHKDETLPLKDGHVKPQRPIVPNSIGMLLVGRMLFGQFQDVIMDDPAGSPFSIGINPHSLQWGRLGERLDRGAFFDMDIKQQDASVAVEDGLSFADVVSDYFDDGDAIRTMRRRFVQLLFNMPVVYDGKVWERGSGNPSGCAITQLLASYSSFCDVYSGFKAAFGLTPELFVSRFSVAFLGDDCAIGTDIDVSSFDANSFAGHLATYGRIVTSGDKLGLPRFTRGLDSITYLSRSFAVSNKITYAPMDVEDLYQPLHFLHTKYSDVTATAASMLIEAFHHGKDFYDAYVVFLFQLLNTCNCALPDVKSYGQLHDKFYDGTLALEECPWFAGKAQADFRFTPAFRAAFRDMYNVSPVEAMAEVLVDVEAAVDLEGDPVVDKQEHSASTAPDVVIEDKLAVRVADVDLDPYKVRRQDVERTYVVSEFGWSENDARGTRLAHFFFPRSLTDIPNIFDRLQYYRYMSATVVVTFRVTSTRFHQGRLLVAWVPAYDRGSSGAADPMYSALDTTACSATISAGSSQSITVRIPFSCGNPYLRWQEFDTLMSMFVVHVLLPLRSVVNSSSVSDARVMVYAAFEDVKVAGMIPEAISVAQGPTSEQAEKTKAGVVSGPLAKIAEVSALLAPMPVIGGVAKLVSFATGIGSRIAKTVGFDKPTNVTAPSPMLLRSHQLMANCVGLDTATMLSMDPAYRTMSSPAYFNSEVDEFSLMYLARLPSELRTFTFADTAVSGTTVATWRVEPFSGTRTWLGWAASFANLWRGSIVYRIGFTASAATRSRIRIAYQPYDTARTLALNVGSEAVYADYDIVGDTDVTFIVPYVNDSIWTATAGQGRSDVARANRMPGHIVVTVVNPICNMDGSVTSHVDASVWVSAGPDFQLCYPKSRATSTAYPAASVAQGLGRIVYGDTDVIGDGTLVEDPGIHSVDIVDSLLHLGHRYTLWRSNVNPSVGYRPFDWQATATSCLALRAVMPYMFIRGSVRYRIVPRSRLTGTLTVWCNIGSKGADGSIGMAKFECDRDNDFVVQSPPFDSGRYFVNDVFNAATTNGFANGVLAWQAYSIFFTYEGVETTPKFDLYLALGDDFSAGWPKFCPNMTWEV